MEINTEDRWVTEKLSALDPGWTPDPHGGRAMLKDRMAPKRYGTAGPSLRWAAAATVTLCIAAIAIPGTRAIAQDLWFRITLGRVDVVRVDLSKLPLHSHVTTNGVEENVQDLQTAESKAGFRLYLPPASVLPGTPVIRVIGPMVVEQTVRVADLIAALERNGARDVAVPPEWDGITMRADVRPMISATYPDNVNVLQTPAIQLSLPPGFPLEQFAGTVFRAIGASWWEARFFGKRFAAHPAWLLDIPPDEPVSIQEESIKGEAALVDTDFDEKGTAGRTTVIRTTHERMYAVSSNNREQSKRVAETLP